MPAVHRKGRRDSSGVRRNEKSDPVSHGGSLNRSTLDVSVNTCEGGNHGDSLKDERGLTMVRNFIAVGNPVRGCTYTSAAIPTIGLSSGLAPIDPSKGALNVKIPPSDATSQ